MKLNVVAPVCRTSYSIVAFYLLKYMAEIGVEVSLFPIGPVDISQYEDQDISFIPKFLENAKQFDNSAPCLKVFHQNRLGEFVGKGKHIAYSFFEIDPLSKEDVHHINSADLFISPSKWAKDVCVKSGVKVPIEVVSPSVDTSLFTEGDKRKDSIVKFLHVGKWEKRKCHEEMVCAFGEAFDAFDNVSLDLFCYNPFCNDEENDSWARMVVTSKNGHKIKIINPVKTHVEILNLYKKYDVYASLSHAEGYDLPLVEAMANGLLCMGTYSTAHKDYLKEDNCILVCPDGKEAAVDGKWFLGEGEWDKFNVDDFAKAFVRAKEEIDKKEVRKMENAKKLICSRSWKDSVSAILKAIN